MGLSLKQVHVHSLSSRLLNNVNAFPHIIVTFCMDFKHIRSFYSQYNRNYTPLYGAHSNNVSKLFTIHQT